MINEQTHAHRCAERHADHEGPCRCTCGAIVEAVVGAPYEWQWRNANGERSAFPGASWRPELDDEVPLMGAFVR